MAEKPYTYDPVATSLPTPSYREAGQQWRQYVIAAVANLVIITAGYLQGWTAPILIKLRNPHDTPLDFTTDIKQDAWIGSLLPIGALPGTFIAGFLVNKLGRKWGMISCCAPLLLAWVLIVTAKTVTSIYIARFIFGTSSGMLYVMSPMYCVEISTDNARSALGSYMQLFITFGMLLVYSVGPYVSYHIVAYVGIATVVVFLVAFFFMPETPYYLMGKNNREAALKSLMTIRGKSEAGVEAELDKIAAEIAAAKEKTAKLTDVFKGNNWKAMYISCALLFFQQFAGTTAVMFYLTDIFKKAGSDLDPATATIIVGAVQCCASVITPLVVNKAGSRILLMISAAGSILGLGALGVFFFLDSRHSPAIPSLGWLPIMSLIVVIVSACVGLGPLPWALLSELLPIEVKEAASPMITAFLWLMCFLVTGYFGPVAQALGMHVVFWAFAGCCFLALLFTYFFVPDTKGKSFQEIQDMLAGRSK